MTDWVTIGVTALPAGWLSEFHSDATEKSWLWPCPAVLLQEDSADPRQRRVVYAADSPKEEGMLIPVSEHPRYVQTFGPDIPDEGSR